VIKTEYMFNTMSKISDAIKQDKKRADKIKKMEQKRILLEKSIAKQKEIIKITAISLLSFIHNENN
jgi:hypothetical protein